jgi:hypothetical protein
VVNAIMDACYKSMVTKKWEPVVLDIWRGREEVEQTRAGSDYDQDHLLIKEEKMPDGKTKLILKNKKSGDIIQKYID